MKVDPKCGCCSRRVEPSGLLPSRLALENVRPLNRKFKYCTNSNQSSVWSRRVVAPTSHSTRAPYSSVILYFYLDCSVIRLVGYPQYEPRRELQARLCRLPAASQPVFQNSCCSTVVGLQRGQFRCGESTTLVHVRALCRRGQGGNKALT
ncbi:hypothetical protein VUR80DRAFT_2657 [Thermomyces stellatus]